MSQGLASRHRGPRSRLAIIPHPCWWNQPSKEAPPANPCALQPPAVLWAQLRGQNPTPEPGLTEVFLQPLVSLNELVNQCKVVGVGLIRHYPASCCNLQLPISHQPGVKDSHSAWGRDPLLSPANQMLGPVCTGLTEPVHPNPGPRQQTCALLSLQPTTMLSWLCLFLDLCLCFQGPGPMFSLPCAHTTLISPNTSDPQISSCLLIPGPSTITPHLCQGSPCLSLTPWHLQLQERTSHPS